MTLWLDPLALLWLYALFAEAVLGYLFAPFMWKLLLFGCKLARGFPLDDAVRELTP